jgi:hypothetical protein
MDTVYMPIVPVVMKPAEALKVMELHRRSGVVAQDGKTFFIVKAAALIRARDRKERTLSRVPRDRRVRTLGLRGLPRAGLKLLLPQGALPPQAKVFGPSRRDDFVMLAAAHDAGTRQFVGLVITRSEIYAEELSSPADCFCTGAQQHSLPPKRRNKAGRCEVCDTEIVCI